MFKEKFWVYLVAFIAMSIVMQAPALLQGLAVAALLLYYGSVFIRQTAQKRTFATKPFAVMVVVLLVSVYVVVRTNFLQESVRPFRIAIWKHQLKTNPADSSAAYGLVKAYIARRNPKKAKQYVDTAMPYLNARLSHHPCDTDALSDRAFLHLQNGQPQQAVADCWLAVQCDSTNVDLWDHLGIAYQTAKKPDSAKLVWNSALKQLSPDDKRYDRIASRMR